ncbi:MAG: hypothetical protein PHD02_04780 [Bacilli bacterium]|nr:hypothetical protein [Bacilli bacterium]
MPSRMQRYHTESSGNSRTEKNAGLYNTLYASNDYSNVTSVRNLERTNEIDIEQVKKLIKDREGYQKQKEYFDIIRNETNEPSSLVSDEQEERKYDINEVLNKAKESRKLDDKDENIRSRHYDYLLDSKLYKKREPLPETKQEDIKAILQTITNSLELNNLSNEDLSLDLLNDLKSTREIEDTCVRKIVEESNKIKQPVNDNIDIDKSFYTSSLNFKKEDFDENISEAKNKKSRNIFIKIVLIIILLVVLGMAAYVILAQMKS